MISEIIVECFEGSFYCKSEFGDYNMACGNKFCHLRPGINVLLGDIDSGAWGLSYTLAGFGSEQKRNFLDAETSFVLHGQRVRMEDISAEACYLDREETMLNLRGTVNSAVKRQLKKAQSHLSPEDVRELFLIDPDRFNRPVSEAGNERFRCVAAVGYASGKSVFCFPWLSRKQVDYFGNNLFAVCEVLAKANKIVVIPTNHSGSFANIQSWNNLF